MTFHNAFPTSPLSRPALSSDRDADRHLPNTTKPKYRKAYAHIASPFAPSAVPRLFDPSTSPSPSPCDVDDDDDDQDQVAGPAQSLVSTAVSSRHVSGPARLMRDPFLPSWSPSSNTSFAHDCAVSPPRPSSSFTRSANTRRRSSGFSISAASPTPNFGSLVGSFQESLLSGRMSMPASKPLIFDAEIGVLGMGRCKPSLRCPPHVHVKFPAHFYDFHAIDPTVAASNAGSTAALGSPYVGTIDLEAHYHNMLISTRLAALGADAVSSAEPSDLPSFPGYAIPPKGQIQLIVKYPDLNAVKLFLVPFDLTDMQPGTKTFVRQKTIARPNPISTTTASSSDDSQSNNRASPANSRTPTKEALRFAIHLQFCCPPAKAHHDDRQAGFDGSDPHRFRHRADAGHDRARSSSTKSAKSPKIFLHKTIRLVFGARALDSSEKLVDQIETPGQGAQRFSSYSGPDEEWHQLHHQVKATQCAAGTFKPASHAERSPTSLESEWKATDAARNGLGIAIQNSATHDLRSSSDTSQEHISIVPLNSDPNGERWQPSNSFAKQSATLQICSDRTVLPSTASWSLSSQESSFEIPGGHWPRAVEPGHQDVHQLARSLASSRLIEASTSHQDGAASIHPASTMQQSRPSALPALRPSRIRSASTAGLSEARVQSVSALGRVEEAASTALYDNSISADSPFSRPTSQPTRMAASGRPSLIRKLSEQFARSHTPSPTASPKLKATLRQVQDEPAAMTIDDPDGAGDERAGLAVQVSRQLSTRSIR